MVREATCTNLARRIGANYRRQAALASDARGAGMQQPIDPVVNAGAGRARPAMPGAGWPSLIAIAAIGAGWFMLDAVALGVGLLTARFRFYELAALIFRPPRLLTGVRESDLALTIPFALICYVAIAAALAPRFSARPLARLGLFAPLALMLACGAILYSQATADTFVAAPDANSVGQALANLGNALARRSGSVVSQHLSVGVGSWLSAIGAVYLAYAGIRGSRETGVG